MFVRDFILDEDKLWIKISGQFYKKMFLNYNLENNLILKLIIKAQKSISFFEIVKSIIYHNLITEEEKLLFETMMLVLLKKYSELSKDEIRKVKNLIVKFRELFQVKSNISLLFIICSKSFYYIDSARLTEQQNNIFRLLTLGYSKEEAGKFLGIKFGTVCALLAEIFSRLKIHSTEEALIEILKENNIFKDPSEIINDVKLFKIELFV
ncbi:MAG: hypothetical protein LBD41_02345 [Clostridiales Family XIII bacterium]|jgi:DNA-binding CsgD family transcriptional regulator|nr:hypothetical protein [Clostridiales Family XIII bacterium]